MVLLRSGVDLHSNGNKGTQSAIVGSTTGKVNSFVNFFPCQRNQHVIQWIRSPPLPATGAVAVVVVLVLAVVVVVVVVVLLRPLSFRYPSVQRRLV